VFDGRDPDAAIHQSRGICDSRNRRHIRAQFKIVEIDAPEDDAFSGRSRKNSKRGKFTGMKTDSFKFDPIGESLLVHRVSPMQLIRPIPACER
jgi:hypothetical protein